VSLFPLSPHVVQHTPFQIDSIHRWKLESPPVCVHLLSRRWSEITRIEGRQQHFYYSTFVRYQTIPQTSLIGFISNSIPQCRPCRRQAVCQPAHRSLEIHRMIHLVDRGARMRSDELLSSEGIRFGNDIRDGPSKEKR
jgi:hypothetical protein